MRWRRRGALGLLAVGGGLSLVRAMRLVAPPGPRPGSELEPFLDFFRQTIPASAGYLYVLPTAFGSDTGAAQRLRYELYPRHYDKLRTDADAADARNHMTAEGLDYVVVPDARLYAETSWLRQPPEWLTPIRLAAHTYVLAMSR